MAGSPPFAPEALRRARPQRAAHALALLLLLAGPAAASGPPPEQPAEQPERAPGASCREQALYPGSERDSGRAGTVVLRLRVDASGALRELTVSQGLGEPFDAAARAAASTCTFTPGTRGGTPVETEVELSVTFTAPPPRTLLRGEVVGPHGEPLAGARVSAGAESTLSDAQGRFTLALEPPPSAPLEVRVEKEGHAARTFLQPLPDPSAAPVRYALAREQVLETVVVDSLLLPALPEVDSTPQVSRYTVSAADIDRTPGALEDISRVIHELPGVVADPDLLATFAVRGGGPNEVLYYLEGVPLSNPFHLGGFATLFNPMMIHSAEFFSGAAPARYEPALSGVLDVQYATGETDTPRAWADLSMHTLKLRVDAPVGPEGLSVSLAARRSYFELYFAGLRALDIVGRSYVAPDISEYLARAHYRRGRHELTATLLHASDGFSFLVEPGEELLVDFAGGLELSNRVQLAILRERTRLVEGGELSATVALSRDQNHTSVSSDTVYAQDARRSELFARVDLRLEHSARHESSLGLQLARRSQRFEGEVSDTRAVAPWAARPFVTTDEQRLDLRPQLLRHVLAGYAEHTLRPTGTLSLHGSARLGLDLRSDQPTYAAHASASQQLPTASVLKASLGVTAQLPENPLLLDAAYGNPALDAERAWQLVLGVEQPLPFQALLRVEAFTKWLSHLSVNPDSLEGLAAQLRDGAPAYQSVGTGLARGVDLLLLGRRPRVSYGAALSLVSSERHNPLATGPQRYRTPWDQRLTASVHGSYTPGDDWILSARASFHSGRPYTPVTDWVEDPDGDRYLPRFGATNSATYPSFLEGSVRVERRFRAGPLSGAWYAEVLNVTNAQNVFTYVFDEGEPSTGRLPEEAAFNHLPVRPFLGVRAEY